MPLLGLNNLAVSLARCRCAGVLVVESVSMGADVLRGVAWWKQRGATGVVNNGDDGVVADGARW